MSAPPAEAADLLDLKFLPAWVKEPGATNHYDHYAAEEAPTELRSRDRGGRHKDRAFPSRERRGQTRHPGSRPGSAHRGRTPKAEGTSRRDFDRGKNRRSSDRVEQAVPKPFEGTIRFLPRQNVFENVVAQIKSASVAYSLFVLARLFLEKAGRYEVRLTAKAEAPLFQLGEDGGVSVDREFLERNAFRFAQRDFYQVNVVESDPIKGSFSNVARCRLSGTLLGPTNHHAYQPQLRSLYEQRFSRRLSFPDYQRQIEIVSDPAVVERWKEEARKVTTYTTVREQTPLTFSSAAEAERHFRSHYFPALIRNVDDVTVGGTSSRSLADRILNRAIEEAWVRETSSPSNVMQELASRFRQNGLHIFRHRRGMLFVSPIRIRAFVHEQAGVSLLVNAILEAVSATAGINRKQLFETLTGNGASEDVEPRRLALASDLRWLINEGYLIEFNDGSLDRPRIKSKQPRKTVEALVPSALAIDTTATTMEWPLQLTWHEPKQLL
ncbi:MAG: hypothetical protein WA849_08300 [Candidatus Udaeobacter sp.]